METVHWPGRKNTTVRLDPSVDRTFHASRRHKENKIDCRCLLEIVWSLTNFDNVNIHNGSITIPYNSVRFCL